MQLCEACQYGTIRCQGCHYPYVKQSQYDQEYKLCKFCVRFIGLKEVLPLPLDESNFNRQSQQIDILLQRQFGMLEEVALKIIYFGNPFCCCVTDKDRTFVVDDFVSKLNDASKIIDFKTTHCDEYKYKITGKIQNGYFVADEDNWQLKIPPGSELLNYDVVAVSLSLLWDHCLFYQFMGQYTPVKAGKCCDKYKGCKCCDK